MKYFGIIYYLFNALLCVYLYFHCGGDKDKQAIAIFVGALCIIGAWAYATVNTKKDSTIVE